MTRFDVKVIVVPPGSEWAYAETEWRDSLVVVESGTIELETIRGIRRRFAVGDVLHLAGLRLRLIRNAGDLSAILSAASRRRPRQ
jgi:hypothetical protein